MREQEDAYDHREETENLREDNAFAEDEERDDQRENRRDALQRNRLGDGDAMDAFDPENFGETEEQHTIDEQESQRRSEGLGGRKRLEEYGEQEQETAAQDAPAEPDDIGTDKCARLLGVLVPEGRKERGGNDEEISHMPARCFREKNNQRSGEHERSPEHMTSVQRFMAQEKSEEEEGEEDLHETHDGRVASRGALKTEEEQARRRSPR